MASISTTVKSDTSQSASNHVTESASRKRKFQTTSEPNTTEKSESTKCKRSKPLKQTNNSADPRPHEGLPNFDHGNNYQKDWLAVSALEARIYKDEYKTMYFQSDVGQQHAGKFDDIVLEYRNRKQGTFIFIQVKHSIDAKEITLRDLLRRPKSTADKQDPRPFALEKYFFSYRDKIKINPKYRNEKGEELVANLIIATNVDFEENLENKFENSENDITFLEKIKNSNKTETQPKYWKFGKLNVNIKEKLANELIGTYSLIKLASNFADCVLYDKYIMLSDPSLKPYTKVLLENLIDIKEKKFFPCFISGKDITCERVKNFREAFFREAFQNRRNSSLYKNYKITRPVKLAGMIADKVMKSLKNNSSQGLEKSVVIRRNNKTNELCIDELANFVLIEKKGIRFSHKFLTVLDNDLPHESLKIFRNELFAKVGENILTEIRFIIKNFTTCNEMLIDEISFWDGVKSFDRFDLDADNMDPNASKPLPCESLKDIEEDIAKFFNYLVFAVNYSKKHLTQYCAQYFEEKFNLRDNQWLISRFKAEVNKALDLSEEKFPSNSDEVEELLDKMETNVCKLFLIGQTLEYKSQLKLQDISFREQPTAITNFLQTKNKQVLSLINKHGTRLSVLKVYETLNRSSEYQRDDSFIMLELSTVLSLQRFVVKALGANGVLIIECNISPDKAKQQQQRSTELLRVNLGFLWNELRVALNATNMKLILISPEQNFLDEKFKVSFSEGDRFEEILDENNCITDLTEGTQKKLLEKKNIIFQEEDFRIGEIFADEKSKRLISGKVLLDLIENEKLKIGKSVTDEKYEEAKDYFIQRKLHHIEIKKEFKSYENEFCLIDGKENLGFKLNLEQDLIVLSNDKQLFQFQCDNYKNHNIHWIKKKRKFLWEQSQGIVSKLRQFVDRGSVCSINKITDFNNKVVIVAAEAGMGKSVFLTHLALQTKKFDSNLWIVRINLYDYLEELAQMRVIDRKIAFKFIFNAMVYDQQMLKGLKVPLNDNGRDIYLGDGCNSLELNLFNHFYTIGKVALLFDGFDEISPLHKTTVIDMLKKLKNMNFTKIWLATRSYDYIQNALEDSLSVLSYTLKPFDFTAQTNFLLKFWKIKCKDKQFTQKRAKVFIKEFQNCFPKTIGDEKKNFMSTPLHAFMVAEVFQDTFKDFQHYNDEEFILKLKHKINTQDILQLYYDFCEIKLKDERLGYRTSHPMGAIRFENEKVEIWQNHEKLAIFVTFERKIAESLLFQTEIERVKVNELLEKIKQGANKLGIVTRVVEGKPRFIHETFAEYFAASFLWNKFKTITEENFKDFTEAIIESLILKNKIQICKFFVLYAHKDLGGQVCPANMSKILKALMRKLIVWFYLKTKNPEVAKQPTKILLGLLEYVQLPELNSEYNFESQLQLQLLCVCAEMGYENSVRDLLKSLKSDFLKEFLENDVWELSPLWLAAENGHINVVKIIAKEFSYNILQKDKHSMNLVQRIFELNNFHVLRTCVSSNVLHAESTLVDLNLPLLIQCFASNAPQDVIEMLIENADLNFINAYKYAEKCAVEHIGLHLLKYDNKIALKLIKQGVDFSNILNLLLHEYREKSLNFKSASENSFSNLFNLIKLLLKHGAVYNHLDQHNKTTLEIAEQIYNIHKLLKSIYNLCKRQRDKVQCIYNTVTRIMIEHIAELCKNYEINIEADIKILIPYNNNEQPLNEYRIQLPAAFPSEYQAEYSAEQKKFKFGDLLCEFGLSEIHINENLRKLIKNVKKLNGFDFLFFACSNFIKIPQNKALSTFKSMSQYLTDSKKIFHFLKDLDNLHINTKVHKVNDIHKFILRKKLDDMKSLVNGKDRQSGSLLHYAVQKKNLNLVKLFIEKGANVNAKDKNLKTPLHCAVDECQLDIVEFLLDEGADFNEEDKKGETPLNYAKDYLKFITGEERESYKKIRDLLSSKCETLNIKGESEGDSKNML